MIELRTEPGLDAAASLTAIKLLATRFPGEHELAILCAGRRLTLGAVWLYDASPACVAQLAEFGDVRVV